jgi:hypothetical protein
MAASKAAYQVEKALGHDDNAIIQQDVANYEKTGHPTETMKALCWMGKNNVKVCKLSIHPISRNH